MSKRNKRPDVPDDGGNLQLDVRTWGSLISPQALRFAPPYAEKAANPDGYVFWWKRFRYVFDLPNPNRFPPLDGFSADEIEMLGRYIDCCEDLAESSVLSHDGGVKFEVRDGQEFVNGDFPSREALRGTAVLFRQLASPDEPASYNKVRKAIGRRIHGLADERQDERQEYQTRWNRAHGQLNAGLLTAMVDRKVVNEQGGHPTVPVSREDVKPQELLSLFQYGDLIHWGKNSAALKTLAGDSFGYNSSMFDYISVVMQLSHFYLGYSLVVGRAIGRPYTSKY